MLDLDFNQVIGTSDILFITLDTLRYDVARDLFAQKRTPNLAAILPPTGWEERHSPGNFTYAAHQAFFAGFLPTPVAPGNHPRPFALQFAGSTTISARTCILDGSNIVTGLATKGYHTVCIGGVGFFNKLNPLGNALPKLFAESYWHQGFSTSVPDSTANQISLARQIARKTPPLLFLFINISALHQPNYFYLPDATADTIASHAAALEYVDSQIGILWQIWQERGRSAFGIICSDHGTAYGEDGYIGHRIGHPTVWTVPYAEFTLSGKPDPQSIPTNP